MDAGLPHNGVGAQVLPLEIAVERIRRKQHRAAKAVRGRFASRATASQRVIFIHGCQRSGTSMLKHVFEADPRVFAFGEFSELSSADTDERLRLNPLDAVERQFASRPFPVAVAKPLVESQRCAELLEYFPDARALWLYRNYHDVAASYLVAFGASSGIRGVRAIVDGAPAGWRNENVSRDVRETVTHHYSHEIRPADAVALFWYSRNRHYFDQNLEMHERCLKVRYEDLTAQPEATMRSVYHFAGIALPRRKTTRLVRRPASHNGIELSPAIEDLCAELLEQLDSS